MSKIIVDGNTACSKVAYKFSEISAIYPITPSSAMAENIDEMSANNEKNIFGERVKVVEMQSEAGASGAVHGSLSAGALTTTFTASQGLLLMIPNMHKIVGELLPAVLHVSARAIASHALSIFGDHSDVMNVRQTGFSMLCSSNVQECQDMAFISHICALKSSVPFLHFFDGFRTSHEIQKIDDIPEIAFNKMFPMEEYTKFKEKALNPEHPHATGTAQNPDVFFQNREACNKFYNAVPEIVKETMKEFKSLTGRKYSLFDYYGNKNAEYIIVSMGSSIDTIKDTIDYLNKENNEKYGAICVRLFRPFSAKYFLSKLPKTTRKICVLDRTKESGSIHEPLCEDIISAVFDSGLNIKVIGGRYGLGSKEFLPCMVKSVFDNLKREQSKNNFTIGIFDDVTYTSLPYDSNFKLNNKTINCKFFGLGSDGTVGANKNSIKLIGELTNYETQGYFEYDSKKSGSITISHLRFGKKKIRAPYLIEESDFIACHNHSFVNKYDILKGIKANGTFLLNTHADAKELSETLPNNVKQTIIDKHIKFYTIDAYKIANNESVLRGKINTIMQTCFFKLANIADFNLVKEKIKSYIAKTYSKKGDDVVKANQRVVDLAIKNLHEINLVPALSQQDIKQKINNPFYNKIMLPIAKLEGNNLPVSVFTADGSMPTDTSKFEKRGIAEMLPCWNSENCIQCGKCALVCPHSAINAVLVKKENLTNSPENFNTAKAFGTEFLYRMQVNPLDCTGCGNCSSVCPAKNKAILMKNTYDIIEAEKENYNYANLLPKEVSPFKKETMKGSQFAKSYFQFSGACAGCGETPYIKLLTQLYGDNLIIANATGCSSIYGGSYPVCPYSKNEKGQGPAWSNSLFEDNAEYGYGMHIAYKSRREKLFNYVKVNLNKFSLELSKILQLWIENFESENKTKEILNQLKNFNFYNDFDKEIENNLDLIVKKFIWVIGGDGWAYDIGFSGIDHVLASGEDVRILVLDTEVYSNTGGQSSKATPIGAVAKFASNGKKTAKKNLGLIAMQYSGVYVSQVAMGADPNQVINAFCEAQQNNGPSIIIAYAPCINHGIDMSKSQLEMKKAVDSGYWNLYRFNPMKTEHKFSLDSTEPKLDLSDFMSCENRFNALKKQNSENYDKLFELAKIQAQNRYNELKRLSETL